MNVKSKNPNLLTKFFKAYKAQKSLRKRPVSSLAQSK